MSEEAVVLGSARTNRSRESVVDVTTTIDTNLLLLDPRNDQLIVVPRAQGALWLFGLPSPPLRPVPARRSHSRSSPLSASPACPA